MRYDKMGDTTDWKTLVHLADVANKNKAAKGKQMQELMLQLNKSTVQVATEEIQSVSSGSRFSSFSFASGASGTAVVPVVDEGSGLKGSKRKGGSGVGLGGGAKSQAPKAAKVGGTGASSSIGLPASPSSLGPLGTPVKAEPKKACVKAEIGGSSESVMERGPSVPSPSSIGDEKGSIGAGASNPYYQHKDS
jgi:hypothetical protein